ncbi:acyltransferase [Methyloglobulus sp.]|uniref:acyltransferase n=1 Tax=Methyloglobulus sp. TaxID=2518622 RepID=UPI0032B724FC
MSRAQRIQSVDTFKLLAIIAVIAIHTSPFEMAFTNKDNLYLYLYILINQLARFAVPFFFVVAGYFWGAGARVENKLVPNTVKLVKKLMTIFLFWCVIYLPYYNSAFTGKEPLAVVKAVFWGVHWHSKYLTEHPILLFMQGSKGHLWFLNGLLFSVVISAIFIYKQWIKSIIILSVSLYVVGVLAGSYANTPLGIAVEFNTRNGPFFGTLLFVSGYFMSGFTITTKWLSYGFMIFCVGCVIHFSELYVLWKVYDITPLQNYVFGTYFMGLGVAMMALSNHQALKSPFLSNIGQMTLGIYAIHYIFVDLLNVIDKKMNSPLWEVGYVFIVLILSVLSTLVLAKFQFTRNFALGERRMVSDRRKSKR